MLPLPEEGRDDERPCKRVGAGRLHAVRKLRSGRPAGVPAAGAPANHSPYFDVDEAVFETGVKAEVLMALDYLDRK